MAKTVVEDGGSVLRAPGERWTVAALAVVGTFLLVVTTSPGLRADLSEFAAFAVQLSGAYATGVKGFVLSSGPFSRVAYFLAMVAQVFVAPIPSAPVSLVGVLVFGFWEGLALSLAGSVAGSTLAFLAVRRWGKPLVVRLVGEGVYRQYAGRLDGRGWWLFAVLLVPFTPDDALVALAGLSRLPFWRFLALMVAGRVPASVATALFASGWVTGSTAALFTAGLGVAAVLALGFVYRGRLESRFLHRVDDGRADAGFAAASREGER